MKKYLVLVLSLATILRLWQLADYPAGLNADEAAIGYNAYSLLLTGKDEHGQPWPIHFKSFGDYKPGAYFYLVLPLVKFLGLNIWAVRLPSAVLGVAAVWLIYLLVKTLFQDERLALITAFFLSISPWHLHFSRGGWESNVATTLILAGVYFFYQALKKPKLLVLSFLFFVFSMYTYHSARIVGPILGLFLVLKARKRFKSLKWLLVASFLGVILLIPLAVNFLGAAGTSRFAGVGLLADTGPLWRINELRAQHPQTMTWPVRILHNRFLAYGLSLVENWADHYQGEFLFISGDVIPRSRVPETGQMYLIDILFVALGVYYFLKNRPDGWGLVFFWLGVAPLAAAMTFQTPHALRAHNLVIPLVIISAYGFYQSWLDLRSKAKRPFFIIYALVISLAFAWCLTRYLHQYYVHYPKTYPFAWEDGFQEVVDYLYDQQNQYSQIYVTDYYDQPYTIFAFYLRYPPNKFQQEVRLTPRDQFGFSTVREFANFHFQAINWEELQDQKNILVVGTDEEIPDEVVDYEVDFRNGQPAFQIAKID